MTVIPMIPIFRCDKAPLCNWLCQLVSRLDDQVTHLFDNTHVAPYGHLALFVENYDEPDPDSNDDEDDDAEIDDDGDDMKFKSRSRNKRG